MNKLFMEDGMNNQLEERKYYEEDEIDLLDLIRTIMQHKKIIVATTIICMVIALVGGKIYNNSKKYNSVVVSLNYPEASEGKNPNGTPFLKKELIPKSVLDDIFRKYKAQLKFDTIEDFRQSIDVVGIVPEIVKQRIKDSEKKGEKYIYIPTEYSLQTKNKPEILNEIVDDSIKEFNEEYKVNVIVDKLSSLKNYDYIDSYGVINNKINSLKNLVEENSKNMLLMNKLGYSFDSIMLSLKNIQDIELREFYSYILTKGFTNNGKAAIVKYNLDIKELELQKQVLEGKAQTVKKMLNDYKPQDKTFVLPNGGEINGKIDLTNDYYSGLINEYLNINKRIMDITGQITRTKDLKELVKIPTAEEKVKIEDMVNNMQQEVNEVIDKLNAINKEYYEIRYSNMISISSPVITTTTGKPLYMYLVVGLVLGGCFGIFLAFASEFKKDYKKRYSK